jgi:hypothetical protein
MSRKLDALVAEKVMGLVPSAAVGKRKVWNDLPHYSSNITAAWEVVEKFTLRIRIECYAESDYVDFDSEECWHVDIWAPSREGCCVTAPTVTIAICKAALQAVGVSEEEIQEASK